MVKSPASQFLATTITYFLGSVLAKAITFLLLPLYTAYLSPQQFGSYDFWVNLLGFLAPVAFFQSWDAVYRYHFDRGDHAQLRSNGLVLLGTGTVVYLTMMLALNIFVPLQHPLHLSALGLSIAACYYVGYLARAELRNALFVITGALNSVVLASASFVGLTVMGHDETALYAAVTLGNAAQVLALAVVVKPWSGVSLSSLDRGLLVGLLRYSIPLSLASVGYWLLAGLTRIVIASVEGLSGNGLYAVADRLAVAVTIMITVMTYAWNEYLFDRHNKSHDSSGPPEALRTVAGLVLMGSALVVLGSLWVFDVLVGDQYERARQLVPICILSATLNGIAGFAAALHMAERRTSLVLWTTVAAATINACLAWPLAHAWGVAGAAIALTTSYAALLVLRVALLRAWRGLATGHAGSGGLMLAASIAVYYTTGRGVGSVVLAGVILVAIAGVLARELKPSRAMHPDIVR